MDERERRKDQGFTLVEVIVSMLMLSIVIVSVLAAFSRSASTNTKSKKIQSAESLLENLVEYTEAGGKEVTDRFTEAILMADPPAGPDEEIKEFDGLKQGFHSYKIRITRRTNADAYKEGLNKYEVISFGSGTDRSMMLDLSPASSQTYDELALNSFYALHCSAIDEENYNNALLTITPTPSPIPLPSDPDALKDKISRTLKLEVSPADADPDKITLTASLIYTLDDSYKMPNINDETTTDDDHILYYVFSMSPAYARSAAASGVKLENIYILYSPSSVIEGTASSYGDIWVADYASLLNANVFVVAQDDTLTTVAQAIENDLETRFRSKPKINLYNNSTMNVYSSADFTELYNRGTLKKHSLVATKDAVRAIEVTIEILDPSTDAVLAKAETTTLQ